MVDIYNARIIIVIIIITVILGDNYEIIGDPTIN